MFIKLAKENPNVLINNIVALIPKLPIRQYTNALSPLFRLFISKLPIRQYTCMCVGSGSIYISKLPSRQYTTQYLKS